MASSIASLFGPTAEELMYSQQQLMKQQQQQQLQQNLSMQSSPLAQQFYQSGYNIASGIGGLFGGAPMADPRIAQSVKMRGILGDTGVSDLSDPKKVAALSQKFAEAGFAKEALYFADRAKELTAQQIELDKLSVLKPVSTFVTSEGEPVGKNDYGEWAKLKDKSPIDLGDLVPSDTYDKSTKSGGSATNVEQSQSIRYLKERTDLGDLDLGNAGMAIANAAKGMVDRNEVRDFNEGMERATAEFTASGKLSEKDGTWWQDKWSWSPYATAPEQAQAPKEKGTTTTTGTKGTWSYIPEEVPAVVTPSGQPASKELSPAERQRARALKNEELWRR